MATGSLETEEAGCTVVWKIPNFKSLDVRNGTFISSPEFTSGGACGSRWELRCYPHGDKLENMEWVSVFLSNSNEKRLNVFFSFGLNLPCGGTKIIFKKNGQCFDKRESYGCSKGIERSVALYNTINGQLVLSATVTTNVAEINNIPSLISAMSKLFKSQDFADFEIKVGSKSFKVHKCLLSARSDYFSAMLKTPMKEVEEGKLVITEYKEETIEELVSYLYCDALNNCSVAEELSAAAEEYCLPELKQLCSNFLKATVSVENVSRRLALAELLKMPQLKEDCLEFMYDNWTDVIKSPGFAALITENPKLTLEVIQGQVEY